VDKDVHKEIEVLSYLLFPYLSNSLLNVNPVTKTDENNAIIIVCSNVIGISNMVLATLPLTSGEKNDTPKLPNIRAKALPTLPIQYEIYISI
tara:strand:- start:1346 stop:1621 length:276 start_codon:yes stop_codon:yes gene_type:complete